MFPPLSGSMVEITFKSVLLPEPEGPITATNSPFSTSKLTPARARVVTLPVAKIFVTRSTLRIFPIEVLLRGAGVFRPFPASIIQRKEPLVPYQILQSGKIYLANEKVNRVYLPCSDRAVTSMPMLPQVRFTR